MNSQLGTVVLGGGMTGLAAGLASGARVFEANAEPGGICSSYYLTAGDRRRCPEPPRDDEAYRFEHGGGHWIFGGDAAVLSLIERCSPLARHTRRSTVFFHDQKLSVPYPLQNHLHALPPEVSSRALEELLEPRDPGTTLESWLIGHFGKTLCELFFLPFHELYTAGYHKQIAPQDAYKSPVQRRDMLRGALGSSASVGYNANFVYPVQGLGHFARALAARVNMTYGRVATRIDLSARSVHFADGSQVGYERLISTLPLHHTLELASLTVDAPRAPFTSVLVLNLGARRGPECPEAHWLYNLRTRGGFHRVGFYSNVCPGFLPRSARQKREHVSLYVERAYPGGERPNAVETQIYAESVVRELQDWGFIEAVEVIDPTWIEVAYTWTLPGSRWVPDALSQLRAHGIEPVGRYARWCFQGIADSLRDGLMVGASFRV